VSPKSEQSGSEQLLDERDPSDVSAPVFDRIAIIGLGLIGSSIARAARRYCAAREIIALDASPSVLARVRELEIADIVVADELSCIRGADLVVLCAPVGASGEIVRRIAPYLNPGVILTDVGSVKKAVIEQVAPHLPDGVHFVPAHPIAGTECSGPDAGFATLFQNRWCILTPECADESAVEKLSAFWIRMGAMVERMSAQHHDLVLAVTSHLPHLIAYNIVRTADDLGEETRSEVIKFSAAGFRDFTRIAASDPTIWRDIFLNNKEAVLEILGRFNEDLTELQRMIRRGDGHGLFDLFSRTRTIRRSIIEQGQDTAAPDFGRLRG
jgi:cyclohexadieny/prephenate dehydrogenase